jgi:hypothetical protein
VVWLVFASLPAAESKIHVAHWIRTLNSAIILDLKVILEFALLVASHKAIDSHTHTALHSMPSKDDSSSKAQPTPTPTTAERFKSPPLRLPLQSVSPCADRVGSASSKCQMNPRCTVLIVQYSMPPSLRDTHSDTVTQNHACTA